MRIRGAGTVTRNYVNGVEADVAVLAMVVDAG